MVIHHISIILTDCLEQDVEKKPRNCHQCMKKERTLFVPCTNCPNMYCMQCADKWYGTLHLINRSCWRIMCLFV